MNRLILALLFLIPLNALSSPISPSGFPFSSELSNIIDIKGNVAGVAWDSKTISCMQGILVDGVDIPNFPCTDPYPNDNKFYAPTVLIFSGATGKVIKKIEFFGTDCPYNPVSLTINEGKIFLTVQTIPALTPPPITPPGLTSNDYPTCAYSDRVVTLREVRRLNTGALIKRITLEDYRTIVHP
jgi:hypothetical protein